MKKILIFISLCLFFTGTEVCARCHKQECKPPRFIRRIEYNRSTVYNALNLSDEQISVREEMLKENTPLFEEKYKCLLNENCRLKALKEGCAEPYEILKQKRIVKCIENDILKLQEKENKEFEKCLTRDQRSKHKMIKKLEHDDAKKECRKRNLYKDNPQMRAFGNPETCSCQPKNCQR